jgi:hypothetical protein
MAEYGRGFPVRLFHAKVGKVLIRRMEDTPGALEQSRPIIPFLNQDVHEKKSESRRGSTVSTVRSDGAHSTK